MIGREQPLPSQLRPISRGIRCEQIRRRHGWVFNYDLLSNLSGTGQRNPHERGGYCGTLNEFAAKHDHTPSESSLPRSLTENCWGGGVPCELEAGLVFVFGDFFFALFAFVALLFFLADFSPALLEGILGKKRIG